MMAIGSTFIQVDRPFTGRRVTAGNTAASSVALLDKLIRGLT